MKVALVQGRGVDVQTNGLKLQLLGRDAPYYRASNGVFSVEVSNLSVSLPAL